MVSSDAQHKWGEEISTGGFQSVWKVFLVPGLIERDLQNEIPREILLDVPCAPYFIDEK